MILLEKYIEDYLAEHVFKASKFSNGINSKIQKQINNLLLKSMWLEVSDISDLLIVSLLSPSSVGTRFQKSVRNSNQDNQDVYAGDLVI